MTDLVVVLARPNARIDALSFSLVELGFRPVILGDLPVDRPLGESLALAIDQATFVVVVWDSTRVSRSIMFAVGYAVARGARIALLDARRRGLVTEDPLVDELLTFPRLNAPLSNEMLLTQELSAFVELPDAEPRLYRKTRRPRGEPLVSEGSVLEQRAIAAIQSLDVQFVSSRTASLEVPDWKVWVAKFTAPFNPVFVEVTGRKSRLEVKRKQLMQAMSAAGAHLGFLITADDVESRVDVEGLAAVCTSSLFNLESQPTDFEALLRVARNRLLHGPS